MATNASNISRIKPVIAEDDGVRERHGVTNSDSSYVEVREDGHLCAVTCSGGLTSKVTLSPSKARYIARKLYRIARRIERREVGQ